MDKTTIIEVIDFLKKSLTKYGVNVDSIALFGSALNDNMNIESDIDLIIISSDFKDLDLFERVKITMLPETDTMRKFRIPMDIINMTPEEYLESNLKIFNKSRIVA
jgi:uncharacterized protein